MSNVVPSAGQFVQVRGRSWLVENAASFDGKDDVIRLACVDDDAQGQTIEVAWLAEIDGAILGDVSFDRIAREGTDDPTTFAAYLRALEWNTATAADRDLFQAPFRAGIRLDAYQLLPLRKALRLPRVNLLIADDVGLGKTIEAGLVLRELLLRRRIDFALVAAPAGMVQQWQDELEAKFGLAFTIVDREHLLSLRRDRGFGANPWASGSRFILSHSLMADETYLSGLRDLIGGFRPRTLLILDEAHHAAPASGARYAVDSQFTRAMRDMAGRFEHRLFLSATPHNGHSNSFSSLLEILDPQRFTRGVPVRPADLRPIMVRRLKSDLRHFGERFPERIIEPIVLQNLPPETPELALSRMLSSYGMTRAARIARLPPREAAQSRLVFVGLQQRLLSSVAAFAHTLRIHRDRLRLGAEEGESASADVFVQGAPEAEESEETTEDSLEAEETAAATAASQIAVRSTPHAERADELAQVEAMLMLAEQHRNRPDARVHALVDWIRNNLAPDGVWNHRRLVLFTEWEATRRWLERRLNEALADLDPGPRIAAFTGATVSERREDLKRAFNADPAKEPLRILLCTDAAREGINLQARCHDLIHVDLPWNPARLEQRNGRIDRKLQPSPKVWCRYFIYTQRAEDVVLDALVRKTERIREQLGSAGQVISARLTDRLAQQGILHPSEIAAAVTAEADEDRIGLAVREMDDETAARLARQQEELDDLRRVLERSRERVGVAPEDLRGVVSIALARAGVRLDAARTGAVEGTELFRLDPDDPAFATGGWAEAFDDLRSPRKGRGKRVRDWRPTAPVRQIAFEPAILADGADAEGVVQLHLEHRLVRRLLSRFLSQGFQAGLSRACVVAGPGAQPRAVLLGRLALYGPGAARLHEEILPVTALWTEASHGTNPLRPFGERGEGTTLAQLEQALRDPRRPPTTAVDRIRAFASRDASDLEPELRRRAAVRAAEAEAELAKRGEAEATSLKKLLQDQRDRIARANDEPDEAQLLLPGIIDAEREQRRQDRRHWARRLADFAGEIEREPARVREGYRVRATRVDIVGLVYLWPVTG